MKMIELLDEIEDIINESVLDHKNSYEHDLDILHMISLYRKNEIREINRQINEN